MTLDNLRACVVEYLGSSDRVVVVDSGVPFARFAGDEIYGSDRNLRPWLERAASHVSARWIRPWMSW